MTTAATASEITTVEIRGMVPAVPTGPTDRTERGIGGLSGGSQVSARRFFPRARPPGRFVNPR